MARRPNAARGQEILDRWCALAEQRLEHLTELFESGRWRRYHSEASLLENIQEAKSAVETWRRLATREASLDNSAVDISWLDSPRPVPPRRNPLSNYYVLPPPRRVEARAKPVAAAPIGAEMAVLVYIPEQAAPPQQQTNAQDAAMETVTPAAPIDDGWRQALDLSAMKERYPLLRNAL
ncbi:TIGR03809 family protein [uncultured Bradyrhizobium sp.]|uniref:TIGR03809 family protein n=1 Tax=uncultured Bradyrhizobium sp. TaxID=199684 RepID=UPI0035CB6F52